MPGPEVSRTPRFVSALALLALRRAARPVVVLAALTLTVLLAATAEAPAALGDTLDAAQCEILGRGLARRAAWTGFLAFVLPALLLHAGGTFERWRSGESDWLGARPVPRAAVVLSTWTGYAAGAAVLALGGAVAVELVTGGTGRDALALVWRRPLTDPPRIEPGEALARELDLPPTRSALLSAQVRPTLGAAPTSDARVVLERGGERRADPAARVAGRTRIERAVPGGKGPVTWTLHNEGEGALALTDGDTFELWERVRFEGRASASIALRAAGLAATAGALALALGAVLSPLLAGALAATLALAALWTDAGGWVVGADLLRALDHVGLGRVPEPVATTAWGACTLGAVLSLTCAAVGTRAWGRNG